VSRKSGGAYELREEQMGTKISERQMKTENNKECSAIQILHHKAKVGKTNCTHKIQKYFFH
jgi:hypothetical protein